MTELMQEPYGGALIPVRSRGWVTVKLRTGEVHVVPIADGMYHLPEDCGCRPSIDLVDQVDDSFRIIYVHNSLDNREATEPQ